MTQKTLQQRFKTTIFRIFLVSLLVFAVVLWVCSWTYSEGTRSGNLIKVSTKGVVFKSFEGELNLGGVRMQEGLEGNIWSFTILNDDVAEAVKEFEGKRVNVYYKERYKTMPWKGDTNYIVTEISELIP